MHYLAVGAIFKSETRYLREWLEFHKLVGVEKFYLACNDTNPQQAAAGLGKDPLVEFIHLPGVGGTKQVEFYTSLLGRAKTKWLALIDLDEFLMPCSADDHLPTILSAYERHGGIGVNWKCYGSSGLYFPPALQVESFVYRAEDYAHVSRSYKSIIDPTRAVRALNPHSFEMKEGWRSVDEYEQELQPGTVNNYSPNYLGKRLRINHYRTRSWLDFVEKYKRWQGSGHPDFADKYGFHYYWKVNDTNEVFDDVAHRYLPSLLERLKIASPSERLVPSLPCQDRIEAPLYFA